MEAKEDMMAPTDLDKLIEEWVLAWSSPTKLMKLVALFTEDGIDKPGHQRESGPELAGVAGGLTDCA